MQLSEVPKEESFQPFFLIVCSGINREIFRVRSVTIQGDHKSLDCKAGEDELLELVI